MKLNVVAYIQSTMEEGGGENEREKERKLEKEGERETETPRRERNSNLTQEEGILHDFI